MFMQLEISLLFWENEDEEFGSSMKLYPFNNSNDFKVKATEARN